MNKKVNKDFNDKKYNNKNKKRMNQGKAKGTDEKVILRQRCQNDDLKRSSKLGLRIDRGLRDGHTEE